MIERLDLVYEKLIRAGRSFSCQPFYFIFQEYIAITAELIQFSVNILHRSAIMHAAGLIRTMTKVKGVPQFVYCLFFDTFPIGLMCGNGGEPYLESIGRYDACLSAKLCFTVNMGQDGDKEIYFANSKYLNGVGRRFTGKPF